MSVSPTMVIAKAEQRLDKNLYLFGHKLNKRLQDNIRNQTYKLPNTFGLPFCKFLTSAIKKYKVANCGDKARLANLLAVINGYETKIASLMMVDEKGFPQKIDHAFIIINDKSERSLFRYFTELKGAIIIDPWLGIADYANNVQTIFRNKYADILGITSNSKLVANYNVGIKEHEAEELKEAFPEFIFNKK